MVYAWGRQHHPSGAGSALVSGEGFPYRRPAILRLWHRPSRGRGAGSRSGRRMSTTWFPTTWSRSPSSGRASSRATLRWFSPETPSLSALTAHAGLRRRNRGRSASHPRVPALSDHGLKQPTCIGPTMLFYRGDGIWTCDGPPPAGIQPFQRALLAGHTRADHLGACRAPRRPPNRLFGSRFGAPSPSNRLVTGGPQNERFGADPCGSSVIALRQQKSALSRECSRFAGCSADGGPRSRT